MDMANRTEERIEELMVALWDLRLEERELEDELHDLLEADNDDDEDA